jgi:hypothetical protein
MADPARAPLPLGWCSRCLAGDEGERPAVTMNRGTGLCRDCNAEAGVDQTELARLREGVRKVRDDIGSTLDSIRGVRPPG